MKNLIVKVSRMTRMVDLPKNFITVDGENLQSNLIFKFTDEFVNGQARLEYRIGSEKNYIVLNKENEEYSIPIKNVITKTGKIKMQLVITEGTNEEEIPVFKSNTFDLYCNEFINAVTEAPEGYTLWIEQANAKLNLMDEALEEVNEAIDETNNLNLAVSDKVDGDVTITLTKKDATTKTVILSDGTSLQFNWDGTKLGIKTDKDEEYVYVDLQGIQGPIGPQGEAFRIKKTYPSVQAMNADFNNMQFGDYVMIASTTEEEDNAKLYTKGEEQWIFIADFSGAIGIKGETGATPVIHIGTVTSGNQPSVSVSGTAEDPVLNFILPKGDKGDKPVKGVDYFTQSDIDSMVSEITEDATSTFNQNVSQKTEEFNTNASNKTSEFNSNAELKTIEFNENADSIEKDLDYYKTIYNVLPKIKGNGTDITLDNTSDTVLKLGLSGNTEQDGEPTPDNPQDIKVVTGDNEIKIGNKNLFDETLLNDYKLSEDNEAYIYSNNTLYSKNLTPNIVFKENTAYTIQYIAKQIGSGNPRLAIKYTDGTSESIGYNENGYIYTTYDKYIKVSNTSKTIDYITEEYGSNVAQGFYIKKNSVMIEEGSTSSEYTPHKEQVYNINLGVENLVSSLNKSSNTVLLNGATSTSDYVFKAGTYTISYKNDNTLSTYMKTASASQVNLGTNKTITFTADENFNIWFYRSGITVEEFSEVQLEKGTKANSYTPYGVTPIELCKIGDYKDYIYEDNSKWYLHKEIGKVVLDGSESWTSDGSLDNVYRFALPTTLSNLDRTPGGLSKYFKYLVGYAVNSEHFYFTANGGIYIFISKEIVSNLTTFKEWLSTHNTDVYYPLATPINEEITDTTLITQLNAIKYALAYKDQTNISQINNELPFIIDAETLRDMGGEE